MEQLRVKDFEHWRQCARSLRLREIAPDDVQLLTGDQQGLFDDTDHNRIESTTTVTNPAVATDATGRFTVPKEFLSLAQEVAYHRDPRRWNLLYRVLWRITTDERQLLQIATDDDVYQLLMMEKAVRRDAHKMKAFVRFREMIDEGESHYIAWHKPDHLIVRKVAPFFSRRFAGMKWTILTPDESACWDGTALSYLPGAPRSAAPQDDELEDLWRTYYAHIFNPARIKLKAMRAEMPVRHWSTLPETQMIDQMLRDAPSRVQQMIDRTEGLHQSARDYFPKDRPWSLATLAEAAKSCRACDLACHATQVVFGTGPATSRIVLVGEQPGDQEDLAGQPFVGPAGEVLNRALVQAGIDRGELYVTNVVKHFKFERTAKVRLHKRPDAREVRACRPWFEAEWNELKASMLVCLGATAATALIAPGFRITEQRGQWVSSKYCPRTLATWHPSSILRLPNELQRQTRFDELVADLKKLNG